MDEEAIDSEYQMEKYKDKLNWAVVSSSFPSDGGYEMDQWKGLLDWSHEVGLDAPPT